MRLLKQAMAVLGTVVTIAVLVAIVAPKTAHAVAAALVQIVPGTTTHVGQNESQLVSLICGASYNHCSAISADGSYDISSAYVVPAGYTLIVTDWESMGHLNPGTSQDALVVTDPFNVLAFTYVTANSQGFVYSHEKYVTGIRAGSGLTIYDFLASGSNGVAGFIQGYLVPNT